MHKQLVIAAATFAALLSAGAARADDSSRPLTREEVVAQTLAARQSGELAALNAGGTWSADQHASTLSRDEVVAQTLAARQSGELAVLNAGGTWNGAAAPAATASRDKVIDDFMATRHATANLLAVEQSI